jgi:hypothetical protein
MYVARLICSDPSCAEEQSAEVATVAELDALACECGCALEIIGWPDWAEDALADAIIVRLRESQPPLRRAA